MTENNYDSFEKTDATKPDLSDATFYHTKEIMTIERAKELGYSLKPPPSIIIPGIREEITQSQYKIIKCRKCREEIAMIRNGKGHLIPVNLDTIEETDTEYDSAKHVKHKTTCKGK
ncbi:MAG: hypothetical protein WC358_00085 [Ignavibacteria bacterium]|jgi:hypothetical protein